MTMDIGIGFLDVEHIVTQRMAKATDVIVGMVAYLMSLVDNLLVERGILPDIIANHEESGLDTKLAECLKNEGCRLRYRTVVERQINCPFATIHTPECLWIEPAQIDCRLLDNHASLHFEPES